MPEQFFIIPLPNHPGLLELQAFLKTMLPGDAAFQDPATFHLTLVHVPEPGEVDLSTVAVPDNLPIFGMAGDALRRFVTPEGNAVVLDVFRSPQLTYLQTAIFYGVQAAGLEVSPFSWPGLWKPHVTLARTLTPIDDWMGVPSMVYLQAERVVLSKPGYEEVTSFQLRTTMPGGEPVTEMSAWRDTLLVGEFKGSYPVVPVFPGVDIAALTLGDDAPTFVILPVAEDDVTSDNKRYYSAAFVKGIERQMREKRVTGIRGHLTNEERSTAFPEPEIYWIGAAKVGKVLWGKGYVPTGETRDMVNRLKAIGGRLATSIYGVGSADWDTQRGAWSMSADDFVLEQIDLAPADRAGIPSLAVVPHVTSEMTSLEGEMPDNPVVDKLTVIRELKAEDVALLPEAVRRAILESAPERQQIAELRKALEPVTNGNADAQLPQLVTELVKEVTEQRKALVTAEIEKVIREKVFKDQPETIAVVKNTRAVVTELVVSRNLHSVNLVGPAVDDVLAKDHIKEMLAAGVRQTMGPNQKRPADQTGTGGNQTSGMMKEKPKDPATQQQ